MSRSDDDYLIVMLAKLVDALLRKGTAQDGNWGWPAFHDELREMQASLDQTKAVKAAKKVHRIL